jgi:hypothetical protein
MVTQLLYFDGLDAATTYDFQVTALPELYSAPPTPWDRLAVPQRPGVILTRPDPEVGARQVDITGIVTGTSASDAESKTAALKEALIGREVAVAFGATAGWPAGREYRCVLESFSAAPFAPQLLDGQVTVRLVFTAFDGVAQDDTDTVTTASPVSARSVDVGTAPTLAVVQVDGPATDPTVSYVNGIGSPLGSMAFDVTLGASDSLIIDARDGGSVTHVVSGVPAQGLGLVTNQDYAFPIFRPTDIVSGFLPAVSTSSGDTITVTYRKRYY